MTHTHNTPSNARDAFIASLHPHFELRALEEYPTTVYGLLPDLTIGYVNPAWSRFAEDNNGEPAISTDWGIGANYLDAITPALRPFYEQLISKSAEREQSLHPLAHEYECSSADRFRRFSMQIYALPMQAGYVVFNVSIVDEPHGGNTRSVEPTEFASYSDADGLIVQCAHCRLVRSTAKPERWDWIAEWVEKSPADTSHGLCPVCLDYYYPAFQG